MWGHPGEDGTRAEPCSSTPSLLCSVPAAQRGSALLPPCSGDLFPHTHQLFPLHLKDGSLWFSYCVPMQAGFREEREVGLGVSFPFWRGNQLGKRSLTPLMKAVPLFSTQSQG